MQAKSPLLHLPFPYTVHGLQVSSSTGILIAYSSGCCHAPKPVRGSVAPQIEKTFVSESAAICMFAESMLITKLSRLIIASSSSRLILPATSLASGILSCINFNRGISSFPPKSQNLASIYPAISSSSLIIKSAGHIFRWCFANGATPMFTGPFSAKSFSLFIIPSREGTIHGPSVFSIGNPALVKTS